MKKSVFIVSLFSIALAGCSSGYPITYQSFPESAILVCGGITKGYTPLTLRYEYDKDTIKEGDPMMIGDCKAVWMSGAEYQYPYRVRYQSQSKGSSFGATRPKDVAGLQDDMAFDVEKKERDRQRQLEEEALRLERERLALEKERNEILDDALTLGLSGGYDPSLQGYSKDSKNVYYGKKKISGASASSFEILSDGYGKDRSRVYYRGKKIDNASSSSFVVLAPNYGQDIRNIYFGHLLIKDANRHWFKVLGSGYAKDNRHVFYLDQKIEDAHVATFKVESRGYARDIQNRYYRGKKI